MINDIQPTLYTITYTIRPFPPSMLYDDWLPKTLVSPLSPEGEIVVEIIYSITYTRRPFPQSMLHGELFLTLLPPPDL